MASGRSRWRMPESGKIDAEAGLVFGCGKLMFRFAVDILTCAFYPTD